MGLTEGFPWLYLIPKKIMGDVEDPIVMYLVVRESLNMPVGKMCVQVGHGVQYIITDFYEHINENIADRYKIFKEWQYSGVRKVTLKADEREFDRIKEEFGDSIRVVVDAGITFLEPGTETVIAFFPMYKSNRPKILKRLQAL